jgi:hypothetical protein
MHLPIKQLTERLAEQVLQTKEIKLRVAVVEQAVAAKLVTTQAKVNIRHVVARV